jgi:hypothetical protein
MVSDLGAMARPNHPISDKHDPEKWAPVFRHDHAQAKLD